MFDQIGERFDPVDERLGRFRDAGSVGASSVPRGLSLRSGQLGLAMGGGH